MMKAHGFTLIELVFVIVLIGVTAVTFTSLISNFVYSYIDTSNRQDSTAMARIALDRLARELREAMPISVRISNNCLQFLPVNSSTVYTALTANSTSVTVMNFNAPSGSGYYAAVYPINSGELYGTIAMQPISSISTATNNLRTITLASGFAAPRNSPSQRLYVVSNPVSYCLESSGQLNRYTSAVTATQPSPGAGLTSGSGATLVDKLSLAALTPSHFAYSSGNWQNNALVTIVLAIQQASSNNEILQLDHEVWLRDVQ